MNEAFFEKTFKNEKLKEILRDAILRGDYKPGDLLPSQNEMCVTYGVGSHTVREAVASLVHEGLLVRIQGKGTFVANRKLDKSTIGFVTTRLHRDLGTHYRLGYDTIPMLVQAVAEEAENHGASVILRLDHGDAQAEREALLDLVNRRVGGIILYYTGGARNRDCLEQIRQAGIPLVLVDRYVEGSDTDYVVTDNYKGAYDATEFLLENGFERIYHLTLQSDSTSFKERLNGYRQALADHGVPFDSSLVRTACVDAFPNLAMGADFHESYRLTQEIVAESSGRYGIFAATSTIVAGAWRALQNAGVQYENIGLSCFDVPIQGIPRDVRLLKVVQPIEEMARKAIEIIIDKLNGKTNIQHIVLQPTYRKEGAGIHTDVKPVSPWED